METLVTATTARANEAVHDYYYYHYYYEDDDDDDEETRDSPDPQRARSYEET